MAPRYRSVERVLYELGGPPQVEPASPRLHALPSRHHAGPRGPFRESIARLDLSIAARRLTPDEIGVVRDHYILKTRRHKRAVREPIIRHLISLLEENQ